MVCEQLASFSQPSQGYLKGSDGQQESGNIGLHCDAIKELAPSVSRGQASNYEKVLVVFIYDL